MMTSRRYAYCPASIYWNYARFDARSGAVAAFTGGPTIRLARGLSFRLGASDSTGVSESESFDELRQIDQGTLILTTKRLAFLGSLRTNSSSLET